MVEPIDVAATAEQLAGGGRLLRGLGQLARLQRGIGLRQLGLPYLAQAGTGTVVVRFERQRGLEQFARTGAVLAVQMASLQGLLRLPQHVVEIGARQHAAQGALIHPHCGGQSDRQQEQQRKQPATPTTTPRR
ncbi:hypothetical protein [Rhodanobacter umsongensis]